METVGDTPPTLGGTISGGGTAGEDKFNTELTKSVSGLAKGSKYSIFFSETESYVVDAAIYSANGKTMVGGYPNPCPNTDSKEWGDGDTNETLLGYAKEGGWSGDTSSDS